MRISVNGRHLVVTDPINDYTVKRVEKLDKYFDRISEIVVTLSAVKLRKGPSHTAEMRAHLNSTVLKAVATESDLYVAIDKATSILEGQIKKYKEKLRDNNDVVSQRVFKFDPASNTVSTELYVAIDKATSILEGQIKKYKEKLRDNNDVVSQRVFKFDPASNTVSTEATKQIVKVSMESKPMTLEEAILQMETLGKDF